jgi:hypothetical protein
MAIVESIINILIYRMGSFFYGNPFGKNTGLYAYIASNISPSISF